MNGVRSGELAGREMLVKTIAWAVRILTEYADVACVRSRRAAAVLPSFSPLSPMSLTNYNVYRIVVS